MKKASLVEALSPLLMQLAEVKDKTTRCDTDAESPEIDELFKKIEGEIGFIKDILVRLERWERDVQDEFGVIANHLGNISVLDGTKDDIEELRLKYLSAVHHKVSTLKEHMTPPLQLPATTMPIPTPVKSLSSDDLEEDLSASPDVREMFEKFRPQLQECVLSLSIFPEKAEIKKRLLIYWWTMAKVTPIISITDAEDLLKELIRSKLIKPICRSHSSVPDRYMVPPSILKELIRLADELPYKSSHVKFHDGEEIVWPADFSQLLTCINVNRRYLKFERMELMNLKRIVVLHLGRLHGSAEQQHIEVESTKSLDGLGSFKALRYLSLHGISRITELPRAIGKLTNLTILDLRACHNLERLPAEMRKLSNLTHLDVSECYLLDHMPKGLGSLSKLQVIKGFVIGSSRSQDPCRIGELRKLKKLRKMSINIRRDSVAAEGELSQLKFLEPLRALTITWGEVLGISTTNIGDPEHVAAVMDVTLPGRLEKLDVRCFPGYTAPLWLRRCGLNALNKLYIRGGRLRTLSGHKRGTNMITQLSVKILRLKFLHNLDLDESELLKAFPSLDYLEIHDCKKLTSTNVWLR